MRMIKTGDFWIGLIIGIILFYLYTNHMQKGSKGQ